MSGGKPTTSAERRAEGLDELNLLEWAVGLLARQAPADLKTLTAKDTIEDKENRQKVERNFIISAPGFLTLPNWQDQDILSALFKLTRERTGFKERELRFSLYEILKSLDLSDSGHYCRRVSQSLDRWSGLWLKFINAWRKNGKWCSETFHIIDRVKLNSGGDYDPHAQQVIYWNDLVLESVAAKHTRSFDWDLYLSLSPTAKRMDRFLDKRFGLDDRRPWTFELVAFGHHKIGLSRNYGVNKCKEKLLPAILELEAKGKLRPMPIEERFTKQSKGLWHVHFAKAKRSAAGKTSAATVAPDLVEQLTARSITPQKAATLAANHSRPAIEEKIRYYDIQRRRGKNLQAGFLVSSIEQQYELPASQMPTAVVFSSRPALATTVAATPANAPTMRVEDPQQRTREAYWESLPPNEQERLAAEAFQQADRIALDGWHRSNEKGLTRIAAEYRQAILNKYLDRLIATYRKAS